MYRVETDEQAQQQINQLPAHALAAYAELRILLEASPWSGEPINEANPDAEVRTLTFGAHHEGMAVSGCRIGHLCHATWVPPGWVLRGQAQHQLAQRRYRGPAAGAAVSGSGPVLGHQVPVPPQHRGGSDDPMQPASLGQPPDQRCEHRSIMPDGHRPNDAAGHHRG